MKPQRARHGQAARTRLLTAVALCDGHDSAIMSVNQELVAAGAEVVYLGYHRSAAEIARAAVQEDVTAVGISSYNGGHREFFAAVAAELRARGREDIRLFGGGGATIPRADAAAMREIGVDRIYPAGTPLDAIIADVVRRYARPAMGNGVAPSPAAPTGDDAALGRWISVAEQKAAVEAAHEELLGRVGQWQLREPDPEPSPRGSRRELNALRAAHTEYAAALDGLPADRRIPVIGFAGPGGAGKSTLIDELVSRCVAEGRRVGLLCNDPVRPRGERGGGGALLADRASMVYSQHDGVFQRSLPAGGRDGVSRALPDAIRVLRAAGPDLVFVETIGVSQDAAPFTGAMVDLTVLVLTPEYGGRLQLEKLALLEAADVVVLNKADRPQAAAAAAELRARLGAATPSRPLHCTVASRHRDLGVDVLYRGLLLRAGARRSD